MDPQHRRNATWTDDGDINGAMLATCLVPEVFLDPTAIRSRAIQPTITW